MTLCKKCKNVMGSGKSVRVNINYLMGILQGFKNDEEDSVLLTVKGYDSPLIISDIIMVAQIDEKLYQDENKECIREYTRDHNRQKKDMVGNKRTDRSR